MRPPKLITGGLGNRRSTESRRGRAARMARKLRREGYSKAAESMALQAAQIGLVEPSTKTQDYRWAESNMQQDVQDAQRRRQARVNAFLRRNPYYGQQPDADAYDGDVPRTWSGPRRGGGDSPMDEFPPVRIKDLPRRGGPLYMRGLTTGRLGRR